MLAVCLAASLAAEGAAQESPRVASRPRAADYFRPDPANASEHPLLPAIRWAKDGLPDIQAIEDYSCKFVKRERIDGELMGYESMFMKVRHEPFSVYMKFLSPKEKAGREVIYVAGQNNNNLMAHETGIKKKIIGTVSLKPQGMIAMAGNRYPINQAGVLNLVTRLIEVGEQDAQYGECEVKFMENARLEERPCTCIQVIHPVPRKNFTFHLARIYVDQELNIPVRYEAYEWPKEEGGEPVLNEEYTYLDMKLNNGFTDLDFDVANPEYDFPKR
jgi:hypothetical protein